MPNFRQATIADIPQMSIVRFSVKENVLVNKDLVTDKDYVEYLTQKGKGWVCEIENKIVGFAIADLQGHSIWALFVQPEFEKMGIGKKLHNLMLDWIFANTQQPIWLGTSPGTRAEIFYKKCGWLQIGTHGKNEIKFEMNADNWKKIKAEEF